MPKHSYKSRAMNKRERQLKKDHTRLVKFSDGSHALYFEVGGQSFSINRYFGNKARAIWTQNMLAIALAKIEP